MPLVRKHHVFSGRHGSLLFPTAKRGWEFTRTLLRLRADLVLPWKCVQFRPLSLSLLKLQGEKLGEEMSLLVLARAGWLLPKLGSFFSIMLS